MKKNNTYLITGTSGFIGTHLLEELASEGCPCICLDRRYPHKNLRENRNMTTILGDLIDKQFLESEIRDVDVCIHLASIINSKDKTEFERANIQGMANIIDVSLKNKVKKFIYVSTCDIEANPHSLYAKTKLGAEEILKKSSLNYTILRPAVVYGKYDTKNISSIINFVKISPLIPIIGNGEYKRQPLYVKDLISVIKKCIELEYSNRKIYNLGGPFSLSMNEIVRITLKVLNKKRFIVHLPINITKKLSMFFSNWNPFLRSHLQQLLSIEKDKIIDIKPAEVELHFKPIEFELGLKMMLGKCV